jgi:hypothetical protein
MICPRGLAPSPVRGGVARHRGGGASSRRSVRHKRCAMRGSRLASPAALGVLLAAAVAAASEAQSATLHLDRGVGGFG